MTEHCHACQGGRMLMSFEGWQFKFEIRDRSEEV